MNSSTAICAGRRGIGARCWAARVMSAHACSMSPWAPDVEVLDAGRAAHPGPGRRARELVEGGAHAGADVEHQRAPPGVEVIERPGDELDHVGEVNDVPGLEPGAEHLHWKVGLEAGGEGGEHPGVRVGQR